MSIAANRQTPFRMIDHRVREEAPEHSHHEDESDHSDLACRADSKRGRVDPNVVAIVRQRLDDTCCSGSLVGRKLRS